VTQERRPYSQHELRIEKVLSWLWAGGWPAKLWGLWPGALDVHLIERRIVLPGRDPARPPLRIAFASDLHLGPTTPSGVLDNAFALLRSAKADVLALGGDYVFLGATHDKVKELNDRVTAVEAPIKIAVLGNHDFWARPARLEVALSGAGTIVLVNEAMRLPPPHDDVALIGLDDPYTSEDRAAGKAAVNRALGEVADAAVKIAICHSPDGLSWLRGKGVHFLMCGHTHGGHLALPGGRPLVMSSPMGRLYPWGFHDVDGLQLFVSRGVGGSLVPVRTWAPPDVAILTFVGPGAAAE
jgi:predicted MPP superfamily phosphohydrolase